MMVFYGISDFEELIATKKSTLNEKKTKNRQNF